MNSDAIPIVVINGSVRLGNCTAMASALADGELQKQPGVSAETLNPAALHLPLPGTDPGAPGAKLLQQKVTEAAGVVLATPEYHGSFSSVMKLVIENLGLPSVLAGKPVALLGVAAESIGATKSLEHLRGVAAHIGAIALPLPVSVAKVQQVFDANGNCLDPQVEQLNRKVGMNLLDYLRQNVCPRLTLERLLRSGVPAALSD